MREKLRETRRPTALYPSNALSRPSSPLALPTDADGVRPGSTNGMCKLLSAAGLCISALKKSLRHVDFAASLELAAAQSDSTCSSWQWPGGTTSTVVSEPREATRLNDSLWSSSSVNDATEWEFSA